MLSWLKSKKELVRENEHLREEAADYNRLFDLQWTRTREAGKEWQLAHNKPNVIPDLGTLIEWLLASRLPLDAEEILVLLEWANAAKDHMIWRSEDFDLEKKLKLALLKHQAADIKT